MIYEFFKNPSIQLKKSSSLNESFKELFRIILWSYLLRFISYPFIGLADLIINAFSRFSFVEAIDTVQAKAAENYDVLFFLAVAPVLEELIFRLPLKISRVNILVSLLSAYVVFYLSSRHISSLANLNEIFKIVGFGLICTILVFRLKPILINSFYKKYFGIYFYATTLAFGLIHINNFIAIVPQNLIWLSPIFILAQIISGFFLGYIRLKNGITWSILLHFLFNLMPTIAYFAK